MHIVVYSRRRAGPSGNYVCQNALSRRKDIPQESLGSKLSNALCMQGTVPQNRGSTLPNVWRVSRLNSDLRPANSRPSSTSRKIWIFRIVGGFLSSGPVSSVRRNLWTDLIAPTCCPRRRSTSGLGWSNRKSILGSIVSTACENKISAPGSHARRQVCQYV